MRQRLPILWNALHLISETLMFRQVIASLLAMTMIGVVLPRAEENAGVVVASPWEIASYDPAVAGFAIQSLEIMENLVNADEKGVLLPGLASSWSASEDGLTWTFALRDGVTFHDGTPFNAKAAEQVLNRALKQPGVLAKTPVTAIAADGESLVFTLERPFAALPAILTHATTIVPAPSAFDADGNPVAMIGTGPYKVEKFTPPQSVDMVRNDAYWGEKPAIGKATYLASGRAETRALLAESGDADMVFNLDPSGFSRLLNVETVETTAVAIPRVVILKVNAGHPFFSDAKARQALSLAIDRKGIATAITRYPEAAATQLFPPALTGWHDPSLPPLGHDVEQAKALLAELGWVAGDDGILAKDGERFKVLLRTFPDRPELPLMAAALQDQWRAIGVELEVSVASYSEIPAGHQDGTLEVALYARNYGLTPDPIGTTMQDFGIGGGDWGSMGWDNAEVAEALNEISMTADPDKRAPYIAQVAKALQDELPLLPITWYQHTAAVSSKLDGVVIDPLQRTYGLSKISWKE